MLDGASKAVFYLLADSALLRRFASRYGLRGPAGFARRFIPGESVDDAIEAARALETRGLMHTLDHLGERVTSLSDADAATRDYLAIIDAVVQAGIGRNLSLKLTQLGLVVDKGRTVHNLRRILERAEPAGVFLRIDMENSPYLDVTLEIFRTLWLEGHRQIGVVLQSAIRRSEQDLRDLNALGARIRLVKGAYKEPRSIAYERKTDVDAAYARMLKTLLTVGHYPAIATHDTTMVELARRWALEYGVAKDHFEFQMLYGIRRDLQDTLARAGYRVRVYIPFGREWFPYFMRRLGEHPANVGFVIRGILADAGESHPAQPKS